MYLCLHCNKEAGLYCTQEVVLYQRAAKCGLHNSIKLGLFCDIHKLDCNITKQAVKSRMLEACENFKTRASTCLTVNTILSLNFSCNKSSAHNGQC